MNIIDPLNVIMGLRLSDYKTYRDNYGKDGQFTGVSNELRNRNEITPYFGVTYDINPNLTAYASYTRLFQPQSYKDINENFLDPITGVNREIGLKGSLMEEALQFSWPLSRPVKTTWPSWTLRCRMTSSCPMAAALMYLRCRQ